MLPSGFENGKLTWVWLRDSTEPRAPKHEHGWGLHGLNFLLLPGRKHPSFLTPFPDVEQEEIEMSAVKREK